LFLPGSLKTARKLKNACDRMIFPNKGTVKKVDAGEKCNKRSTFD
jgi:hypothetical protein